MQMWFASCNVIISTAVTFKVKEINGNVELNSK